MVTWFPSQPARLLGKPVPSMVRVVPPPTLPEAGENETISSARVKVTEPEALPALFTQSEISRSPAGPSSRVQVTEVAEAAVLMGTRPADLGLEADAATSFAAKFMG